MYRHRKAVLSAVNLGGDTATIAAVTGGMAALWYGYSSIPPEWLGDIKCRGWIRDMCTIADVRMPIRLAPIFLNGGKDGSIIRYQEAREE